MINISRESEINLINILIDQDIISGKDLAEIKKVSSDGNKSQLDAVFELNLTDEQKILDLLVHDQSLDVIDLSTIEATEELKAVLPSNYINMNFIAPFKIEGKVLHIAISDISKLSLMRNLRTITKMDIELHAAKVSDISNFVDKLLADGERTISDIRQTQAEKTKTFDYDVDEQAEVLESQPEEILLKCAYWEGERKTKILGRCSRSSPPCYWRRLHPHPVPRRWTRVRRARRGACLRSRQER